MSLISGLKKNLGRAGTSFMQRTGIVERTVDEEFKIEYDQHKALEKKVIRLFKEAQHSMTSMRDISIAKRRIAETLSEFEQSSSSSENIMTAYMHVLIWLDEEARLALDAEFRKTILEPLERMCMYYPAVQEAVKHRQKLALDYDTQRAKVRNMIDKSSPVSDSGHHALPTMEEQAHHAREMYEELNLILVQDLARLIELRVPYLDPSFDALVKSESNYAQAGYDALQTLEVPEPEDVNLLLQEMRELSICGNQ
ncbi:BAR adaptor protein Hob3 [Lichtheimia hyalospora FSU 10163]|nr:BAR adaptor protein Hob3 [Lichtheimia hyalospora FSU 10163]